MIFFLVMALNKFIFGDMVCTIIHGKDFSFGNMILLVVGDNKFSFGDTIFPL